MFNLLSKAANRPKRNIRVSIMCIASRRISSVDKVGTSEVGSPRGNSELETTNQRLEPKCSRVHQVPISLPLAR